MPDTEAGNDGCSNGAGTPPGGVDRDRRHLNCGVADRDTTMGYSPRFRQIAIEGAVWFSV